MPGRRPCAEVLRPEGIYDPERDGLVINDLPTVESKAPSQFGGVLLASARHAPLAPDKGYNTHDTLSLVYTAA